MRDMGLVKVDEPGPLQTRLDTAWQEIKAGLVRGLSIGFRPQEYTLLDDGSYGMRFVKWLWLELSAVTIPANIVSLPVNERIDLGRQAAGYARARLEAKKVYADIAGVVAEQVLGRELPALVGA